MRLSSRLLVMTSIMLFTNSHASSMPLSWDDQEKPTPLPCPAHSLSNTHTPNQDAPATSSNTGTSSATQEKDIDFIWVGCNLETMRFIICPCNGIHIPGSVHTEGVFWEITLEDLEKKTYRYSA